MAEDFAEKGLPQMDFGNLQTPKGRQEMFPTSIAVACTLCHATGTLMIPKNFDHRMADKIVGGRIVRAFCKGCNRMADIRPFTPKELRENGLEIIKRYCQNYHALVTSHPDRIESAEKMLREAQSMSEDFIRQLRTTLGQTEPMLTNAPPKPEGKPFILEP